MRFSLFSQLALAAGTLADCSNSPRRSFYHRGQVFFITGDYERAIAEYRRSSELDPVFIYSHIQLAVAQYKNGQKERALHLFRKFLKDFEDSPEVFNYYGELLLDQSKFEEAVGAFEKAIALDKDSFVLFPSTSCSSGADLPPDRTHSHPRNVLPIVNQALAIFQWKQDFGLAEAKVREALEIDPQCDVGIATLAQLLLQQNKVHEAVGMFARSAELSRTEPELINALTYENVRNFFCFCARWWGVGALIFMISPRRRLAHRSPSLPATRNTLRGEFLPLVAPPSSLTPLSLGSD